MMLALQGSTHLVNGKSAKAVPETIFTAVQRSRAERCTDDEQWQNKAYGMSSSGETASDMMVS
jgi:hypothetical protein